MFPLGKKIGVCSHSFFKSLFFYCPYLKFVFLLFHFAAPRLNLTPPQQLPVYPELSISPKDGGARSDGHSDAATKSATVRLQTGPTAKRGEYWCYLSSSSQRGEGTERRSVARGT